VSPIGIPPKKLLSDAESPWREKEREHTMGRRTMTAADNEDGSAGDVVSAGE
jgi:hypothetical protein